VSTLRANPWQPPRRPFACRPSLGSTARRSRRLLADTPGSVPVSPAAANG
jgi:hypothetical protein